MKTFKLHLIRHGLTQGNKDGIYVGGGMDIPLCDDGRRQIEEMARRYRYPAVPLVFSSPMKRALQTAEIIYPLVSEKMIVEELRENRFGEFEGKSAAQLMQDERFAKWLDPQSDFTPEGGESGQEFAARCAGALGSMLRHQAKHNISEAACITHGGVIMMMLGQLAIPQKPPREWLAGNGQGFTVQADAAMLMRDGFVEVVAALPSGYSQ